RAAADVDLAHLAGAKTQRRVRAFTGDNLHRRAGASRELRSLAGLELDAMHLRADRNALQRHRVARLDRCIAAGLDRIADLDPLRREDVAPLAVPIKHESEVRAAVRIVLEPLDAARDAVLVPAEVDEPIVTLVAAAPVAGRNASLVVPAAGLRQRHDEGLVRIPFVQRV